jgi:hypothetical protein
LLIRANLEVLLFHIKIFILLFHVTQRRVNHATKSSAFPDQLKVPVTGRVGAVRLDVVILVGASEIFVQLFVSIVDSIFGEFWLENFGNGWTECSKGRRF